VGPNPRIVVVTPSLPERADLRAECMASVAAQTLAPVAHVVMIDYERAGPAAMLNRMLPACWTARADWVAQLADDDLADPNHLELLAAHSRRCGHRVFVVSCRGPLVQSEPRVRRGRAARVELYSGDDDDPHKIVHAARLARRLHARLRGLGFLAPRIRRWRSIRVRSRGVVDVPLPRFQSIYRRR
jgi:hypothetical protein